METTKFEEINLTLNDQPIYVDFIIYWQGTDESFSHEFGTEKRTGSEIVEIELEAVTDDYGNDVPDKFNEAVIELIWAEFDNNNLQYLP